MFTPIDFSIPRIEIQLTENSKDIVLNAAKMQNTLCAVKILDMPINSKVALGEFKFIIGTDGDVTAETDAVLYENGIDTSEFNEELLKESIQTSIPEDEYKKRVDLRKKCIFTIDGESSRDLDDALHVTQLSEDLYEVGVHIADVTFFIKEGSELDRIAKQRLTSVYLVQKAIPMLPRFLCENFCSLVPSEDRLTFSVIWKITSSGKICEEWFGRTIVNSAAKLNYKNVQKIIENKVNDDLPKIGNGFTIQDIELSIKTLDKIAKSLRANRENAGCLEMDKNKLNFSIDHATLIPYEFNVELKEESNMLVEAFMVLANFQVAHRIYEKFPLHSLLKYQPKPHLNRIEELSSLIKENGYNCDITSSGSIQVNFSILCLEFV